jgi:hypothetical protein
VHLPAGTVAQAVNHELTGLPDGEWHVRLRASNATGVTHSVDHVFTVVSTLSPAIMLDVVQSDASHATLTGSAISSTPATAWFEWGRSTAYGSRSAMVNLPANTLVPVSLPPEVLDSLERGYWFVRMIATNTHGTASQEKAFGLAAYRALRGDFGVGLGQNMAWMDVAGTGELDLILPGALAPGGGAQRMMTVSSHDFENGELWGDSRRVILATQSCSSIAW